MALLAQPSVVRLRADRVFQDAPQPATLRYVAKCLFLSRFRLLNGVDVSVDRYVHV